MVNAHSHAFQRAFAGLSERRSGAQDDFWSWRDRMYGVAQRITPAQLRTVAAQLYIEMLQGGYTQVCEFHYLHGSEGDAPDAMAWALADAAHDAGLGLTMLPTLYERAGFTQPNLRADQRRFASTPQSIAALQRRLHRSRPLLSAGIAIHSLRAATPDAIANLLAQSDGDTPIHIHIAEQMAEVTDCLHSTGQRPIAWLHAWLKTVSGGQHALNACWQLVHATHAEPSEIEAVGHSGAGIVLCPSTEGNLGDGLADLSRWLGAGVPLALGSDSHVCRQWPEELRWLEYGQRLQRQQRNVCAAPAIAQGATAARLFDAAIAAGGQAAGYARWGLQVGARADALVLNPHASGLLGIPTSHTLDALVFACDSPAISDVYVAGRAVLRQGQHPSATAVAAQFSRVMQQLWNDKF